MTVFQRSGWTFATNQDAATTMKQMRAKVLNTLRTSREAIAMANRIVAPVAPRDKRSQVDSISDYMAHHFRFVADPVGVELLRNPTDSIHELRTLGYTQGDCDEAAMITAVFGMANGIPARFRSVAFGGPFVHVMTDLAPGDGLWYPIDITKPPGFMPPDPSRSLILPV